MVQLYENGGTPDPEATRTDIEYPTSVVVRVMVKDEEVRPLTTVTVTVAGELVVPVESVTVT